MRKEKSTQHMIGYVTKYYHNKGYGFIRAENGKQYIVRDRNLDGEYLDYGYTVDFRVYADEYFKTYASDINVINAPDIPKKNNRRK